MATVMPDLELWIGIYQQRGWTLVERDNDSAGFERYTKRWPTWPWVLSTLIFPVNLLVLIGWIIYARTPRGRQRQRLRLAIDEDGGIARTQWREPRPSN